MSERILEKPGALRTPPHIPSPAPVSEPMSPLSPVLPPQPLSALARAHAPRLARLLRHLGVPSADLEDAVQDVFLVAHRRMDAEVLEPEAWLRGVALNVARNRRRAARRSPLDFPAQLPEVADARTPEREAEVLRNRRLLAHCLEQLHEEKRTALVLFEIEGVPMKEIATHLGCSLATAYRHLSDAQTELKRAVERGGRP